MLFKEITNAVGGEKSIKKLAKKYKNKKVIIYGAGQYSQFIFENYDLSGLNIVCVADKRYKENSAELYFGHKTITPEEILKTDYDVILIAILEDYNVFRYLKENFAPQSKIDILIKPDLIKYSLYKMLKI